MDKWVSFRAGGSESWGLLRDDGVVDLGAVLAPTLPDLRSVIAASAQDQALRAAAAAPRLDPARVQWLPVIPNPGKILCVGLNYQTHVEETGRQPAIHPTFFTRFADTQIGQGADILLPRVSTELDYEGELAVIIGRGGRYLSGKQALEHVAGYACYNDATLRDWQRHSSQFTPGKNFPGTGGFGPWMVSPNAIADLGAMELITRVNGQEVQRARISDMLFSIQQLIEYCSTFTPLSPGDVIATGTPGGVGFKRKPQLFLRSGDIVEVDISGIGCLRNGVAEEPGDG